LWPVFGWLLLALYAIWPFAHGDIEASVIQQVRAELDAKGYSWARMTVSGQNVQLQGLIPQPNAGDQALAIARATPCPTWVGDLVCPVHVTGDFGSAVRLAQAAAVAAPVLRACKVVTAGPVAEEQIEFASGSAILQPQFVAALDTLVSSAKTCPQTVQVQGFTDAVGDPAGNRVLSLARANAVRQALVSRGLPASDIAVQGFGVEQPLANNDTSEGRSRNRRVALQFFNKN